MIPKNLLKKQFIEDCVDVDNMKNELRHLSNATTKIASDLEDVKNDVKNFKDKN